MLKAKSLTSSQNSRSVVIWFTVVLFTFFFTVQTPVLSIDSASSYVSGQYEDSLKNAKDNKNEYKFRFFRLPLFQKAYV